MLLNSQVYGRRSRTGTCIARLKTSVWKRQSFKITARLRVICERSLDVPITATFSQVVHNRIEMLGTQLRCDKVRRVEGRKGPARLLRRDATRKQFLYQSCRHYRRTRHKKTLPIKPMISLYVRHSKVFMFQL